MKIAFNNYGALHICWNIKLYEFRHLPPFIGQQNISNPAKIFCSQAPMLKSDLRDYSDVYIVAKGATDLLPAAASENVYHF